MIAYLTGRILTIETQSVILNAHGVGYRVFIPATLFPRLQVGGEAALHIHYHYTSEYGPSLYGFEDQETLKFFEDLLSVSGIGPKIALAIISQPIDDTKRAIVHGDTSVLQRISGVGKKTGERIVLELKNKITIISDGATPYSQPVIGDDALDGLIVLGFSKSEALDALRGIDSALSATERIKQALKQTGRS